MDALEKLKELLDNLHAIIIETERDRDRLLEPKKSFQQRLSEKMEKKDIPPIPDGLPPLKGNIPHRQ